MVNYKRVVCEAVVLATLLAAGAAAPAADCADRHHYDQRQNGTENYRLNIDGVVIAVAPAEALLSAASDFDISDLLDLEDFEGPSKPSSSTQGPQLTDSKPDQPAKPDGSKPDDSPANPESPLSDVTLDSEPLKGQKKEAPHSRKHEKGQRLKLKLANMLLPLLRKSHHH